MKFSFESSSVWGFTYNANILKTAYSDKTIVTNPQREATFYGKFSSFASLCPDEDFQFLDDWFEASGGSLARCLAFHTIPLDGLDCDNGIVWKAFISPVNTPILKSFYDGVETPYVVTCIYPTASNVAIYGSNEFVSGSPGTQISVSFKFKIAPENSKFSYIRKGSSLEIAEIPFIVLPRKLNISGGGGGYN
jgi:hypothetical protein